MLVESAGAQERRVELLRLTQRTEHYFREVRGADYKHKLSLLVQTLGTDPIDLQKELRQDLLGNGARRFITIPVFEHAVNLIEEDDAGTAAPRTLEDVSNASLALANLLAHQLRDLGTYEVQVAHLRARTQNRRLSRAGRPVQKNARGWRDVEMAVFLPLKRPLLPTSMCKQGLMM